jgi:hypothetical protein
MMVSTFSDIVMVPSAVQVAADFSSQDGMADYAHF